MRYSNVFWEMWGLPITAWDDLLLADFRWMKAAADDEMARREAATPH